MPPPPAITQALTAAMQSGPAQRLGDEHYKPRPQQFSRTTEAATWELVPSTNVSQASTARPGIKPNSLRLISWNIDVLVGFTEERMSAALVYLESLVTSSPPDVPIVIFLQEMGQSDLNQIRDSTWIEQRFFVTDLDHKNWLNPLYGTTTLIDHRLTIKTVFRVPFLSKFDRDGLFVDIILANIEADNNSAVLRLCNVHLESLVADPPVRPSQLAAAAEYLHAPEVNAALLAGDLNAIQPFDRELHSNNGLRDTYLELGGNEDSDEGYTWGPQAPTWMREKFGCSRMDKILFTGNAVPRTFERIGMRVKVDEDVREEVEKEIEGAWVTDHYGVMGDFEITGGS